MKGVLLRWVVSAVALYLTVLLAQALGIGLELTKPIAAFVAVAALAIVNALIRPLLLVLALPLNCLTLGVFTFVINALMFWLAGRLVDGFEVRGILAALFGSIVMGIISGIASSRIAPKE